MDWIKDNNHLTKTFSFENQTELARFFLKVAQLADEMNHHPDSTIYSCNQLELRLTTHDKGEITELDNNLAKQIDELQ